MKIPVSASKNLVTGEMVYTYAETTEQEFTEVLVALYNKAHPDRQIAKGGNQ